MFSKMIPSVFLSLAAFQAVSANPVEQLPEIVPGEGLPSLASLGLTSADLYAEAKTNKLIARSAAFQPGCGPRSDDYTSTSQIAACSVYLNKLGRTICQAGNGVPLVMCESGNTRVAGQSLTGGPTSSYCSDVSLAVNWVLTYCNQNGQTAAGYQAANGNGNFVVEVLSSADL